MCCSPGAKLCYIADLMKSGEGIVKGSLTGVDISEHRMNTCKGLLRKYWHEYHVNVFVEDGTKFSTLAGQNKDQLYDKVLVDAECTHDGSIKHLMKFNNGNKKNPTDDLNKVQIEPQNNEDKPPQNESEEIVAPEDTEKKDEDLKEESKQVESIESKKKSKKSKDNETTIENKPKISNKQRKRLEKQKLDHTKYLQDKKLKTNEWSNEDFEQRVMNKEKIENITNLQKSLCLNAFKLLKVEGILVYSTCSFTQAQNEDVVEFLLNESESTKGKLVLIDPFDSDKMKNVEFKKRIY